MHFRAIRKIHDLYPRLFERSKATESGSFARSGLKDFGWRGKIYEIAQDGAVGTLEKVEDMRLYDFMNYLSYIRAQSKYREIRDAQVASKNKAKRK